VPRKHCCDTWTLTYQKIYNKKHSLPIRRRVGDKEHTKPWHTVCFRSAVQVWVNGSTLIDELFKNQYLVYPHVAPPNCFSKFIPSVKRQAIWRKFINGMFFDDETIYGGHLCPHTYENEDKNKKCWKSRQLPFHSNCFVIWIAFICKDLHCDVKFKGTEKKKESKKKHFVQKQQFTILMYCNDLILLSSILIIHMYDFLLLR